jgi:hypothetical protein
MTEKERFAHYVMTDFGPCYGAEILARVASWDAEIALRKKKSSLLSWHLTSSQVERETRQTSFEFGPRARWPHK